MNKKLMLGNEAIARGLYEAGVKVVSSYPGTPSTEITEFAAKYDEIYAEWAPNEKVAVEVAAGAAIGGARAFSVMKHVGLNVAADPFFITSYIGTNGGLVIGVADDPGMHSSQNEQDSRHYARAAKVPMLEPSDSQECKDFIVKAYELSEKYDTSVAVRLSTRVSHSQSMVELCERNEVGVKEYTKDFAKYTMMPAQARVRHVEVEKHIQQLKALAEETPLNRIEWGGRRIGIIASGISYQYAKEALGESASYLKLGMVYPMPEKLILEFASQVDQVYVVEELDDFIETHCKKIGVSVIGKEIFSLCGELSADIIREKILGEKKSDFAKAEESVPVRPPVLCPGCPHRGTYYVLNKMKLHVQGDIGCYTLGALAPLSAMDTSLCMGGSITSQHGFEKARGRDYVKNSVAVIGDSTFIHSGITGLIDVVYNKGTSTILILDNSITGMTGHQQNPITGYTLKGEETSVVDLEMLAHAVGVKRVRVVDPFDLEGLEAALKEELAAEEPSVIIVQRPCALLKYVKFDGPVQIDSEACKRCGMCMKIGCPAIHKTETGYEIDDSLCNGCGLCQKVCKFGAIQKGEE